MTSIKGRYARIEIPLDKAETDKELHITGDYLSIVSITGSGTCEVKLDHRHSQPIDLREITGITGVFERLYFTSDGDGGTCSLFVGNGIAINISPNPEKLWSGGMASGRLLSSYVEVKRFSDYSLKLYDVTVLNQNPTYECYVGAYNSDVTTFKDHAYRLYALEHLNFKKMELAALGLTSCYTTNPVLLDIIGRYE